MAVQVSERMQKYEVRTLYWQQANTTVFSLSFQGSENTVLSRARGRIDINIRPPVC
jgi:hypothetical protein